MALRGELGFLGNLDGCRDDGELKRPVSESEEWEKWKEATRNGGVGLRVKTSVSRTHSRTTSPTQGESKTESSMAAETADGQITKSDSKLTPPPSNGSLPPSNTLATSTEMAQSEDSPPSSDKRSHLRISTSQNRDGLQNPKRRDSSDAPVSPGKSKGKRNWFKMLSPMRRKTLDQAPETRKDVQ
ncbi:hypothetical protein CC1G_08954 [Coprinopsis cinerea okayama7|uniref:Uncharacterized protein n=1 Tax=Coprinopsis cinerea (strain Okayama-7 / 130 / ATCC MYA-4618 / FGSC 9003) TaxID=240176 RepID=A8P4Q8_COPC7|nr:hypothetical protein CC1G_08954 [Coprinopsis cinerea okayama7\|eukprot:XP_001838790.2 hypothetical protein CC1G_08954 [Coprinopsis cinerea okayama7\